MPRVAVEDSKRISLRMSPEAKSRIARAAALLAADILRWSAVIERVGIPKQ